MLNLVTAISSVRPEDVRLSLDEIAREGARRMLIEALQAEVSDYIDQHKDLRDEAGKRLVVRHGKAQTRSLTLGAGTLELRAPRVKDRRPGQKFSSKILPAYLRKSPKVENLLPVLYLKGLSSSDFRCTSSTCPALTGGNVQFSALEGGARGKEVREVVSRAA